MEQAIKKAQGFASMTPSKRQAIARLGGIAAHKVGTAHEFTPEEARVAGRKGGTTVSADREHMSRIGRMGGGTARERRRPQPVKSYEQIINTSSPTPSGV